MPEKETLRRAAKDRAEGKAPTTQAGEFVREEIEHIREGKHGASSAKQAIAIGLAKARRAGVKLPPPPEGTPSPKKRSGKRTTKKSAKRSKATLAALKKEPRSAASKTALSRHAHQVANKRSAASRSRSAKKAAATRKNRRQL